MLRSIDRAAFVIVSITALAACGSAPPPAPEDPKSESAAARPRSGGGPKLQMQAELGEIDQAAVEATMSRAQAKLQECHRQGLRRVEYLAGDVKFFLRIGEDGRVKYGYFEESTLGDRDTEKCIMGTLEAQSWPKPQGGEAEVRKSFGFDAPGDVRAPTSWHSDKLAQALGKAEDDVGKCKSGASGPFKVTAYVEPDGKQGKVQAVGIAHASKDADDKIECLLKAVKHMKLPSPGSYPAKVSFVL